MSNPLITRLGVNQFWYKHWYSKKNYANSLQQDKLTTKVLHLYLNHGLTFTSSPFLHEFWYKPSYSILRVTKATDYSKFFRRFFYSNEKVGVEHSYLIRNQTGEYFPMKVWLFRYAGWFVISIQWYKPVKGRRPSANRYKGLSQVSAAFTKYPLRNVFRRTALTSAYVRSRQRQSTKAYVF